MATMTIAGVQKLMQIGWEVIKAANAPWTINFSVLDQTGAYRPALDATLLLQEGATTIFDGFIASTHEKGVGGEGRIQIVTDVSGVDQNQLAEREYATATIPTGTLKAALTAVVGYLPYVTLDAGQANGPTLVALAYDDVLMRDVLNDFANQTGWAWKITGLTLKMTDPSTVAAPFTIGAYDKHLVGDVTVEPMRAGYANYVAVKNATSRVQASDAGEIAAHGIWSVIYTTDNASSVAQMQALANALLAQKLPIVKKVTYTTHTAGIEPGMTQTIVIPYRNLNNLFLITEVRVRDSGMYGVLDYLVTAVEGVVYRPGWREVYKQWAGSAPPTATGAGGGSSSITRYAYPLGGTETGAVQSSGPTWIAAAGGGAPGTSAFKVQINTAARGISSATIFANLRALDAGVSVQARLYDVTNSVACPELSSVVTSTTWVPVSWTVTLNAGSHLYELELLPGTANSDVQGSGYLE